MKAALVQSNRKGWAHEDNACVYTEGIQQAGPALKHHCSLHCLRPDSFIFTPNSACSPPLSCPRPPPWINRAAPCSLQLFFIKHCGMMPSVPLEYWHMCTGHIYRHQQMLGCRVLAGHCNFNNNHCLSCCPTLINTDGPHRANTGPQTGTPGGTCATKMPRGLYPCHQLLHGPTGRQGTSEMGHIKHSLVTQYNYKPWHLQ